MEEKLQFDPITILAALLSPILLWFIYRIFFLKPSTKKKLPPSPRKLPIIGNLHQLSSLPHHELRSMARKHGPIMLLHFGSVPVLIVSSAELARQVTKTHDLVFADRPMYKASKKLLYGCKDVGSAPYGEYWRRMKSIFVLQMLSNKRVQSFRTIREEEVALLVKEVEECCGRPLNLSEMFAKVNFDEVFRSSFGVRFGESDNGKKFLRVIRDFMELLGVISISDIAAGTWVLINAFAIGRDPISWDEPEKFMPERFLNSSIDFKGQDFELIPFGAGRRGCPGIAYAAAAMEFVLANLVLKFDWTLANGVEAKDLDMKESPGIAVHRAVPLLAIAS